MAAHGTYTRIGQRGTRSAGEGKAGAEEAKVGGPQGNRNPDAKPGKERHRRAGRLRQDKPDQLDRGASSSDPAK